MTLDTAIQGAYGANERKLAARIAAPPTTLDAQQRALFSAFEHFCRTNGVRAIPAAPATVAAYLCASLTEGDALAASAAITAVHDSQGLGNPVATSVVRHQLNLMLEDSPPRSWRPHEQLLWATLPPEIRAVVARRERDRDVAVRRKLNELAELKKRQSSAEETALTDKEQTNDQTQ